MYKDTRLGGVEKWYNFLPSDVNMRIPTEVLESVCFLCVKENEKVQMAGTAFFIELIQDDFYFCYLFTAKHVIDEVKQLGYETIYARLNKVAGGVEYVELGDITKWISTEDIEMDIAFLPFSLNQNIYQAKTINTESIANEQIINSRAIGIGDELFSVGLFTKRKGSKQNIPIVRTGIISAMPIEPFFNEFGEECYLFLAELRSISGLSGCPVFVYIHKPSRLYVPDESEESRNDFEIYLLGILRGHWDDKHFKDTELLENKSEKLSEPLNTGIATITPAKYILDFLDSPPMAKLREDTIKRQRKEDAFTED